MKKPQTTLVTGLSHDGRGIARIDGKTVFIQGALPNEEVLFVYTRKRSQYAEGEVVEILKPSPERVNPPCPHFNICAGCSLQHIGHNKQIELKQQALIEQFKRLGEINIEPKQLLEPLVANPLEYRRKARLSVKYVRAKEKLLVGFHESNGRFVADIASCPVLDPKIGQKILELAELIQGLTIFDQIPQLEVACGDETTSIILRCLAPLQNSDQESLKKFATKHNIIFFLQPKGLNSIQPLDSQAIPKLSYKVDDLELNFAPYDFIQVNKNINAKMIARALEMLNLDSQDIVLDLFCGLGNFTLPIAKRCQRVIGVEGDSGLVARAKANAELNKLDNAIFYAADLTTNLSGSIWLAPKFSKLLLDPPRTGALEILQQILPLNIPHILYISCNPATLARDSKEILASGYKLNKIGILDMFPHTKHVETIAEFTLN